MARLSLSKDWQNGNNSQTFFQRTGKMETTRRHFFKLVAGAALLPVIPHPTFCLAPFLWGDQTHDDTYPLQALLDGEVVEFSDQVDPRNAGWHGDTLTFPRGNFGIKGTLAIAASDSLKVYDGNGATISAHSLRTSGVPALSIKSSEVKLTNFTFVGFSSGLIYRPITNAVEIG